MAQVEALALDYLVWGLARLGWQPSRGDRVTPASLAAGLGVLPRYERLLRRFLDILAEAGMLSRVGAGVGRATSRLPPPIPRPRREQRRGAIPAHRRSS